MREGWVPSIGGGAGYDPKSSPFYVAGWQTSLRVKVGPGNSNANYLNIAQQFLMKN